MNAQLLPGLGFLFLANAVCAQPDVTVFPEKTQVLYRGIKNPLSVSACTTTCEDLVFRSPNAEIIREADCRVSIEPRTSDGYTILYVRQKSDQDTNRATKFRFTTKSLPPPLVALRGSHDGFIKALDLLGAETRLRAYLEGFDFAVHIQITSFSLTILRTSGSWQEFTALQTADFTASMKQAFVNLWAGDRLIFSEIKADMEKRRDIDLAPVVVTIE